MTLRQADRSDSRFIGWDKKLAVCPLNFSPAGEYGPLPVCPSGVKCLVKWYPRTHTNLTHPKKFCLYTGLNLATVWDTVDDEPKRRLVNFRLPVEVDAKLSRLAACSTPPRSRTQVVVDFVESEPEPEEDPEDLL